MIPRRSTLSFFSDQQGAATVGGLFWVIFCLMLSSVVIDGANGWRIKAQLRATTDAAVLAAAKHLDDLPAARQAAMNVAAMNMDPSIHGNIIGVEDVAFGYMDDDTGEFVEDDTNPTVVRVTGQRSAARGNAMRTYLLGLVGRDSFDVGVTAVAAGTRLTETTPDPNDLIVECRDSIILTQNALASSGQAEIIGAHCLHGATGVSFGGADTIGGGAQISAEDISTIQINGLRPASQSPAQFASERVWAPAILPNLSALWGALFDLQNDPDDAYAGALLPGFVPNGTTDPLPITFIDGDVTYDHTDDLENQIIVVDGDVAFTSTFSGNNFLMVVHGQVTSPSSADIILDDAFIVVEGPINLQGDTYLGRNTWCADAVSGAYLLSQTSVYLGGNSEMWGATIAAPNVSIGAAMQSAGGLYVEAAQYMHLGNRPELTACANSMANAFPIVRPQRQVNQNIAAAPSVLSPQLLR